jgi:hypothetical protein
VANPLATWKTVANGEEAGKPENNLLMLKEFSESCKYAWDSLEKYTIVFPVKNPCKTDNPWRHGVYRVTHRPGNVSGTAALVGAEQASGGGAGVLEGFLLVCDDVIF